jgi:hypothetical protein
VIVALEAGSPWRYEFDRARSLVFASVSPRGDTVRLQVMLNGVLVEALTTGVPHSWWKWAGNALFPGGEGVQGDVLEVSVLEGSADLRVDFE